MASSFSTILRLELMANGENVNTWGQKTNTNLVLIQDGIGGMVSIAVDGTAHVLSTHDAATDEARMAILKFTGTLTANQVITAPSLTKKYIIWNTTTGSDGGGNPYILAIKTSTGASVFVAQGGIIGVFCDGTDFHSVSINSFEGDVDGGEFELSNVALKNVSEENPSLGNVSGIVNVDYSTGSIIRATLVGDWTPTITNWPAKGGSILFRLQQDPTGSRKLILPVGYNDSSIDLTATPNAVDYVGFINPDGNGTTVDCYQLSDIR